MKKKLDDSPTMCCSLNKRTVAWVTLGCLVAIALGIVLVATKDSVLKKIMESSLILINSTQAYPNWKSFPVPIYTSLHFFNVTNAKEVQEKGAKPILVEVGPYVFQEHHSKTKLRWNDRNHTVTYQQVRTYRFDPERTKGSLDDVIMTLNVPAVTVNAMLTKAPVITRGIASVILNVMNEKLFVAKTVRQLSFEGYKDPVLTDASKLPDSVVPKKMDKFGYFYPRNGSDWFDGIFNMYTGQGDLSKMGQVYSWNFTHQTKYFPDKCGEVRGAGDMFSPGQDKTYIELFSNDLCRPLHMDYAYDDKVDGIKVNTYKISPAFLANKTENPSNWCYNPGNEIPSGLLNLSSCQFGAPVFISQPHFYQADPIYLQDIQSGLRPNKSLHETVFYVEPTTGVSVKVSARFQTNFLIQPIPEISMFKNIRKMYFPTIWFESNVGLTSTLSTEVWMLSNLTNIFLIFGLLFIASGLSFSIIVTVFFCTKNVPNRRESSNNPILNESLFQESSQDQNLHEEPGDEENIEDAINKS